MAQQTPKRAYEAPQFTVHGTVADITLAATSGDPVALDGAGGYADGDAQPPQLS